ncbi:MAG: DUF3105 domain-containing protein [Chloroflexota bacterium]|nr:DUF3105 domain-containing protein [Chloroflexota bacterium]
MTQTSPQPAQPAAERVSSRQKRIEEQRRKIEVVRTQHRRRRMLWGSVILVVVALAAALVVLFFPRPVSSNMRQVVTEAATHVEEGGPLSYANRPPSSGVHFGTLPQAAEYRMYDQPLNPGRWVHMLEHGAIVVLYRPDLCDATCVEQLGKFYDSAPRSSLVGVRHLAITPYQDMDHAIAVVAWGFVDEMDHMDTDRVTADFKSKVDASTAPERGAL